MNDQKRKERKKKKREKIRKDHLDRFRHAISDAFEKVFLSQQVQFPPDLIPDREDAAGWERINIFRYPIAVVRKAKELYPDDKILRQWLNQKVGINQKDKHMYLLNLFVRASFELCGSTPYFFPLMTWDKDGPAYRFFSLKRLWRETYKVACNPKYITIDGEEYELSFSSHFIERLWERTAFIGHLFYRGLIFSNLMLNFKVEATAKKDLISLLNTSQVMSSVFGSQYPFGYSPFIIENGRVRLITFLLPGYHGTPEFDLGHVEVEAVNIFELDKYRKQFEQIGVNSFLSETIGFQDFIASQQKEKVL